MEPSEVSTKRNAVLVAITTAIAAAVTPEEVYRAVVEQVGTALGASSAGLWLVEGRFARLVHSVGYSEKAVSALSGPLDRTPGTPALDAIRDAEPVWLDSQQELLAAYPHLAAVVTPGRNYCVSCLPILARGEALGGLAFTFDGRPAPGEEERHFLLVVAGYCAQAIERLRLFEAERTSRQRAEAAAARLALLNRASRAFAEAGPDLLTLLGTVVREVNAEYGECSGITLRADEQGDDLVIAAVEHRDPELTGLVRALLEASPLKLGKGISGRVAQTGEPTLIPQLPPAAFAGEDYAPYQPFLARWRPASLVVVPLRARGRVLGTLSALRGHHARPFDAEDLEVMQELADRAGLALESGQLHRENEQARARAEVLYGLAAGLINAEQLEEIFSAALDGLERALGAERCSILVYDEGGVMRFKAWRGLSDEYRRAVDGHSPWTRDAVNPEPIVVADVEEDPELRPFLPLFRQEGIRGLAFIPLVAQGQLMGKFMVYSRQPRHLGDTELGLARAIANHVAAAITRFETMAELERTVHFNELFMGMLGYDLRNPLAAILTSTQLLLMREEGARLVKPLARVQRAGERMARMIEQLLDFTRVRVGSGIPLEPRPVDLSPLIAQVAEEFHGTNDGSSLRVAHVGDVSGTWDPDRLSQVLSNLIANALEHGDSEQGCSVRVDGSGSDWVRIHVHNRGTIHAELLPQIFEPMKLGERRRDRSRGLGLGLFISQQIVRSHGGHLEVRSDGEQGTTFTVILPRVARPDRESTP